MCVVCVCVRVCACAYAVHCMCVYVHVWSIRFHSHGMVEWGESALANSDIFCGSLFLCEGVVEEEWFQLSN